MKLLSFFLFFGLIVSVFFSSCKKNEDVSPPLITILSPEVDATYQVFDQIPVEVIVEDDQQLTDVKFDVIDEDGMSIVPLVDKIPASKKENISISLNINNIHTKTGSYHIRIVASDGVNQHSEFIKINIQEIPLALSHVFLFNTQTPAMDSLNINENISYPILSFNSEPVFAKSNSFFEETIVAFNNPSQLIYLTNDALSSPVTISLPNDQSSNFYSKICLDPITNHYYIATKTDGVQEIGALGIVLQHISITPNRQAVHLITSNNLLIVEEKNNDFSPDLLNTYYKNSGVLLQSHYLIFSLVFLASIDDNEILLLGNDENNQGIIAKYLIAENTIITLDSELSPIVAAKQINNENFAISFDSNLSIIHINTSDVDITQNWSMNASYITYDFANNHIYGINDGVFNINLNSNQIQNFSLEDYAFIELMYNK